MSCQANRTPPSAAPSARPADLEPTLHLGSQSNLIAAVPKMLFPFLVILPGMIALVLGPNTPRPGKVWSRPSWPLMERLCFTPPDV